jgi:integrase/recombinase XerD
MKNMKGTPIPMAKIGDYLDYEDCLKYEQAAVTDKERILIGLLWRCGLRVSEAVSLRKINVNITKDNPEDSTISVIGKGGRPARVPVSIEMVPILDSYIYWLDDNSYLFPVTTKPSRSGHMTRQKAFLMIREMGKRCGIETTREGVRVHPHTFRHSLAIFLTKSGVPLPKIQQILRHSSLVPTTFYLQFNTKELAEDYHKAFERRKQDVHDNNSV